MKVSSQLECWKRSASALPMTATWSPGLSSKVRAVANSAGPTLVKAQAQNNTDQVKSGLMLGVTAELYASHPALANRIRPDAVMPHWRRWIVPGLYRSNS